MKSRLIYPLSLLTLIFCFGTCTAKTSSNLKKSDTADHANPNPGYYIDINHDSIYEQVELDEIPVPFMGKDEFFHVMLKGMSYPAEAREKGIQGQVILQPFIDEFGHVIDVTVRQSLSPLCDQAAMDAFLKAAENGYAQLKWDAEYVKYKFDFPMKFVLP